MTMAIKNRCFSQWDNKKKKKREISSGRFQKCDLYSTVWLPVAVFFPVALSSRCIGVEEEGLIYSKLCNHLGKCWPGADCSSEQGFNSAASIALVLPQIRASSRGFSLFHPLQRVRLFARGIQCCPKHIQGKEETACWSCTTMAVA